MASVPEKSNKASQVLYMPAVSIVVPESRSYAHGSLTYTYTQYTSEKPSIASRIFGGMVSAVAFVIGVFLFAIPVTIASLILLNSVTSPANSALQNQNVPGIVKVVPSQAPNTQVIRPADE